MSSDLVTRAVSRDEAHEIARRLINSHFRQEPCARVSIPANPDRDDDLLIYAHIEQQAARIEALEGEVERLNKAHDERLKQNTLERAATHKQFHRAEAAEARAERLRERHKEFMTLQNALERVAGERAAADARAERLRVALENIDATALDFGYYEDGARTMHQHARKALEDDKQ
jgi:DNA repair ATPase RecN